MTTAPKSGKTLFLMIVCASQVFLAVGEAVEGHAARAAVFSAVAVLAFLVVIDRIVHFDR